nr:hypothetical protein BaRGS_014047 [Batillaria attramentaria]
MDDQWGTELSGKSGGNVRIISRRTAERALLKGFTGGVSEYHRVIWCPYWPDEDGDDDADGFGQDSSKMLAITQEESIELWAVDMVTRDYGAGPLNPDDVESGRIVVIGHKEPIIDAVFSPDGSALATASLDGEVKFFQVDWSDTGTSMSPRCLHQWQPHDGQPLSYLAFLDDLTNMSPEFLTPPDSLRCPSPTLKACIDASSHFIILSDKLHMVVYVMQIHQDNVAGTAHVSSVSEFPLTQPCLSFAILEASTKTFKSRHDDSHLDEITTGEVEPERDVSQNHQDEDSSPTTSGVQIRLYGVHTKSYRLGTDLTKIPQMLVTAPRPHSSYSPGAQGEAAPSTGSFEVESGATKGAGATGRVKRASAGDGPDIYDENDQEVAEVLGEDLDKSFASSTASGAGATPVDTQEFPPDHITEDERPHKPWPRPPDVSTEAKRAEEEGPDKEPAAEDEYSEDQNEEDEAEIEEEIEEVVEEEEDEEDDTGRDSEQREYVAGARGRGSRDPPIQIIKEIVDRGMLSEVVMQKAIEQLKEQVHTEVAQKLTATDALLKDNIGKMVRSRQTTEAIATAASNALQGPMQSHLRDAFQSHVVPAFEHAKKAPTQTMANQVNTAFQTGTRDYTSQLKSHLEQVRQAQASARDPIVGQLKGLVESFQRETQQMQEQVVQTLRAEVSGHLKSSLQGFQEQLNAGVRTVVRAEISAAMREHDTTMTDRLATYLRSGAATPVPMSGTPDPSTVQALQAQIKQLVNANRLNEAFQTALTASNLELVVFVCELVNPSQVFGDAPCPLSQPVLLSLIQQLSAELQSSFQTKIKFLTEAVMSLDPNEVVTREHIPTVLEALVAKLRRYQSTHPHSKDVKLLLMAAMSLMSR